ncbi:MAG TPA: hypothetical protein VHL31_25205, partial [Geminicoccus sp.]|uniref:hypothetical protein n=1 Tax=Geminicoccus sp. TaxID=2024832 RepID=UPI002E36427E
MAVSTRDLHQMLHREIRSFRNEQPSATVTPFPRRVRSPELELEHLRVELDAEAGLLFARMKHPERACYT